MPRGNRTRPSVIPIAPPFDRRRRVRHRRRVRDQRSTPPRLSASEYDALFSGAAPPQRPGTERQHAAEAAHLPLRQRVMRCDGGRMCTCCLRMRAQEFRQRQAVGVVPVRIGSVLVPRSTRIERAEDRRFRVLHEAQPLDILVVDRDDDAPTRCRCGR